MIQSSSLASSALVLDHGRGERREAALEASRRTLLGGFDLAVQHLLELAPERFGQLLARRVVEHLLLDRLRPGDDVG